MSPARTMAAFSGLTWVAGPQDLTGVKVEAEVLPAVQVRKPKQHPVNGNPVGHMQ